MLIILSVLNHADLNNQPLYLVVKDLFSFAIALAGIIIAGIGLSTWKKQIKGVKEFEIGYDLNHSVLKLREAIKHVRNPMIWNAEFSQAKKKYNETDKEYDQTSVYRMRWEKINEAYTEMESHLLGAEILWGKEVIEKIKLLRDCVKKLNIGLYKFLSKDFQNEKAELYDLVYNSSNDDQPDEFSKEVEKAVDLIHEFIEGKYH